MKLFARPKNESRRAPVARAASTVLPARYEPFHAADRPAAWIASRIWLPDSLEDRIAELIKRRRSSRSALIRETLLGCVYGARRFEQMREQRPGLFWRESVPEFCPPYPGHGLDKNTDDFKIWLPRKLNADLNTLARAAGMSSSNYVRTILILHFMGRHATPERDAALLAASEQPGDGQVLQR